MKYSANEIAEYTKKYPEFMSEIMTLHECFDLPRLKRFFQEFDLNEPYVASQQHQNYLQYKAEIDHIIQSPDAYSILPDVLDQDYMIDEYTAKIYSEASQVYDQINDKYFPTPREEIVDGLNIKPGDKVLEIGIGPGSMFPYYQNDCEVTGIDMSEGMVDAAKKRCQKLGCKNITVLPMNALNTAFPDESFDKILFVASLCVNRNPVKVLREVNRISKQDATIAFFEPIRSRIEEVAVVQYVFQPIGRRMGPIWLTGYPAYRILYNSYLHIFAILKELKMEIIKQKSYDPAYDYAHLIYCKRGEL